jgi:hypothetical protein
VLSSTRVERFSPIGEKLVREILNAPFDPTDSRNIVPRFSPEVRRANKVGAVSLEL